MRRLESSAIGMVTTSSSLTGYRKNSTPSNDPATNLIQVDLLVIFSDCSVAIIRVLYRQVLEYRTGSSLRKKRINILQHLRPCFTHLWWCRCAWRIVGRHLYDNDSCFMIRVSDLSSISPVTHSAIAMYFSYRHCPAQPSGPRPVTGCAQPASRNSACLTLISG